MEKRDPETAISYRMEWKYQFLITCSEKVNYYKIYSCFRKLEKYKNASFL